MTSLIPSRAHVFVDESKSKAYYVVASVIAPADVSAARKAVAALNRAGQRRIHFKSESDASRKAFLKGAIEAGVTTRVYAALNLPDKVARPLCLRYLLDDLTSAGAARLVLESDASLEKADRRVIASYLASVNATGNLEYGHRRPHEEPLLWVSDAVAWCHQKGGDWIRLASPLVQEIVDCVD